MRYWEVLLSFGIDSAKRWKIQPRIVVSRELMTPYLHSSYSRYSYEQLMKEKEQWGILDKMPGPFSLLDLVSRATINRLQDILRI